MPPKSKILKKQQNDTDNESHHSDDHVEQPKAKVTKGKKTEKQQDQKLQNAEQLDTTNTTTWENSKDDIDMYVDKKELNKASNSVSHSASHSVCHSEDEEDATKDEPQKGMTYKKPNIVQRPGKHATNSSINFNYGDFRELVKDLTTQDVLKSLIVRSYYQGQHQLCETLKQTLRALHYECNFPVCESSNPKRDVPPVQQEQKYSAKFKVQKQENYHRPRTAYQQREQEQNVRFGSRK